MIELNLLGRKRLTKLPVLLGLDLNKINVPLVFGALVFYNITPSFLTDYYIKLVASEENNIADAKKTNARLEAEIKSRGDGKRELESYVDQVKKSKVRSMQIEEILKTRTNPKKILEVIARTMPADVSFDSLSIDSEDNMFIQGQSYASRAIGDFVSAINDTPYFGGTVILIKQDTAPQVIDGVTSSTEVFELKGKIKNYDMRSK
jgi:hypothetical protein